MKKLLTVAIVLALLSISIAIAGNAYGKVKNTEQAQNCMGKNFEGDDLGVVPGVGDSVVQCLQSYGIAINSGVCTPEPDGCCNPEYANTDADCGTGTCADVGESCASKSCCTGLTCNAFTGTCG